MHFVGKARYGVVVGVVRQTRAARRIRKIIHRMLLLRAACSSCSLEGVDVCSWVQHPSLDSLSAPQGIASSFDVDAVDPQQSLEVLF